ncbi:lipoprotein [Labedaea rhizosphaerae]|uniref:Uncharacterized protein n=1 Tax=Labedaea rhizosphaerae TaxID=598644 RepID=A0A4R6SG41_LABRH|nr:lipoprotein [Labedaea rhizosphaerae]TDP98056.1 hypothetical protein EV186_1031036 [Labedaea rhizosphaerae]
MRAVALVLGLVLLAACGPDEGNGPWSDGAEQAPAGATIGGTSGPCPLPVTMTIAKGWKAAGVPAGTGSMGDAALACEVDAKPAGHLGFLRIYVTGSPVEPKNLLKAVVAKSKQVNGEQYRESKPGVELTYLSDVGGDQVRSRAYAATVNGRTVLVVLDAFDSEEYDAMIGAYLLAQHTIR